MKALIVCLLLNIGMAIWAYAAQSWGLLAFECGVVIPLTSGVVIFEARKVRDT